MEKPTFAELLRQKIEHAPVADHSSKSSPPNERSNKDVVEPELVAAVTSMGRHTAIHLTKATPGEKLPEGYSRSSSGFLLCNTVLEISVDQEKVRIASERLQRHAIVAYFVGGRQSSIALTHWITALQKELGDFVGLGRNLGHGFFR